MDLIIEIIYATTLASIPILLAGLGELICEKSGVLNLGIEGMMIVGSVSGFGVSIISGSLFLGFIASIIAGLLMASIFGALTIFLRTNQVASGLALSIFGIGLSSFLGLKYLGSPLEGLKSIDMPYLSDIPIIGKLFFQYDLIVYLSIIILIFVQYFLYHTKNGLVLRAIGHNHNVAYSMGYSVLKIRFLAVLFGGAMAGLAGGYISLAYTPLWSENITAGRGWIVLGLVVFANWKPYRLLFGTALFGFVSIAQLFLQGNDGILKNIPIEFFSMLPYIMVILALVLISKHKTKQSEIPASLGIPFDGR